MFQRIIIGCDPGPGSQDAVQLGAELAAVSANTELVLAHVFRAEPTHGWRRREEPAVVDPPPEASLDLLEALRERIPTETRRDTRLVAVRASSPSAGLHRAAEDLAADLLVLGPARHGAAGRLLLGSDSTGIVHGAPCPVAIAPRRDGHDHLGERGPHAGPVGVAWDGSAVSDTAAELAAGLAAGLGRPLEVVGVLKRHGYAEGTPNEVRDLDPPMADGEAIEALDERVTRMPDGARARRTILYGDAVDELVGRTASLDLLVVGSRDHGPLKRVLLGGVSRPVLDRARCPVIVVPRSARVAEPLGAPAD